MNRKSALPMASFTATGGLARTIDFYRARFRNFSSRCRCRSALLSLIRSDRSQCLGATKYEREGVARAKRRSDSARCRYGKQNDRPVRKQVTESCRCSAQANVYDSRGISTLLFSEDFGSARRQSRRNVYLRERSGFSDRLLQSAVIDRRYRSHARRRRGAPRADQELMRIGIST